MEDMENIEKLKKMMDQYGKNPVCLAFSGGVDSSLLLKMTCDSAAKYGNPVYAVTFDTRLHPACDTENAKKVAKELNAIHTVLKIDELELSAIRDNPEDRCYICKKHLFETLKAFAKEKGVSCIIDGTNEEDHHMYRPGLRALSELGIESPLALCGMKKAEVKALAAQYGISAASRPAAPCMATRLPYGTELSHALLEKIEKGETCLKGILTGNIRLRIHGDTARIELDEEAMQKAIERREEITKTLKGLGFTYITLDLEGFRSGSMDVHL